MGDRRSPALTPNPQREGVDHVPPLGEIVETVLGQVDHDALARPRWQDEASRQHDLGASARQPGIDTRVGGDHLAVAQVIGGAQVGEGVFVFGLDDLHLANDVFTRRWQRQLQGGNGARHTQGGKRQAAGDGRQARQHPGNPSQIEQGYENGDCTLPPVISGRAVQRRPMCNMPGS
ncbi:hypothetical protein D3C84_810290 [compost metagenome]